MIEEIRIDNLGVIGSARVGLGPGMTAVTGETGAGKTMVLTGLALLLGGRADAGAVRTGSDAAAAEGRFLVAVDGPVAERAREAGADVDDDGALVVLRTVAAAGRSRAHLGGRSVPQAVLAEIAEHLVTVHGQQDQVRLRSSRHQRDALDAFAGPDHAAALTRYREAWTERQRVAAERDALVASAQERAREAELLRLGLAEVEQVAPQPGEDEALTLEQARLSHAEDLRLAALAAHAAVAGTEDEPVVEGAYVLVDRARRAVEGAAAHDESLAETASRLAEVGYVLADVGADLAAYAQDLQADPERLAAVHERRAALAALARRHGGTVDDVLAWAQESGLRLLDLEGGDDRVAELGDRLAGLDAELAREAALVSAGRSDAAGRLAAAVTTELAGLAMPDAHLEVRLDPLPEPGPHGAEDVALLLAPHAGAPARALGQGASGGELSRVMLALEVALATAPDSGAHRPPTFVFDEVDAGVGGRAAVEVGRRLARLAEQAQVVVVTHLAQVAAFADTHLVVTKSRSGDTDVVTESDVRAVSGEDRLVELARMLSGQEDSAAALQHAAELLERSVVGR